MSKKFDIKPPNWPKEYTFAEFAKLNPHIINENQLITLYNQYLNKYLTELGEKKIHFKQSKVNQLLIELKELQLHEVIEKNNSGKTSFLFGILNLQKGIKHKKTNPIRKDENNIGGREVFNANFPIG